MSTTSNDTFLRRLDAVTAAIEIQIKSILGEAPLAGEIARPARLLAAMRHAAEGGKRLRPFLVIESAALFGVPEKQALTVSAAFECVHCYSLVHDDLPAMDNDDLRRGHPTVHRAFDEATAILVGDALLTIAFDVLARETTHPDPSTRIALVQLLARASGIGGMAGGQMLDLEAEGRFAAEKKALSLSRPDISKLQSMKTGALLSAACEAGALLGRADSEASKALKIFAHRFGLAFQLSDDLIDAEGDAKTVGKRVGKDADRGKATLVAQIGIAEARKKLAELVAEAESSLSHFGGKAAMLVSAAKFLLTREH